MKCTLVMDTSKTLTACIVWHSSLAHELVGEMMKRMEFSKSYLRTLHSMLTKASLFFDQKAFYSVCLTPFTTTESWFITCALWRCARNLEPLPVGHIYSVNMLISVKTVGGLHTHSPAERQGVVIYAKRGRNRTATARVLHLSLLWIR